MENIVFAYDPNLSRKSGQFTVVLTPAVLIQRRWVVPGKTKIYYVKDLETIASRMPDKSLFKIALESEMAFRKIEARFFNPDQEFTRLRIASHHLFKFISTCQRQRILIHSDGSPTAFRFDRGVIPEIEAHENRLSLHIGSLTPASAEIIVQAMPVTFIKGNRIVQLPTHIPYTFLKEIPLDKPLDEAERDRLLSNLSKQPDKVRIRQIERKEIRTVHNPVVQAVVSFNEQATKARLYFTYEGNTVKDNDPRVVIVDIRRHLEISRNRAAEEDFKATLLSLGFTPRPDRDFNWRVPGRPLEFLAAALENYGFAVKIGNRKIAGPVTIRWNVRTRQPHLYVGPTVFSVDEPIGIDHLFQAFQKNRRYVTRSDGSLGLISGEVRRVLSEFSLNGIIQSEFIVFNIADFTSVRDCLEGEQNVQADSGFDALCRFGRHMDGVRRYPISKDLETVLRPYQVMGFNWLRSLKTLHLNGILADDMGLGKSIQVLALIKSLKEEGALKGSVLLIAPKTLLFNWELEIKKWAPDLITYTFAGPARNRTQAFLEKHHLVLTSYGMLRSETPLLCSTQWAYVILDEAQAIKNADTMTAKAVKHIPAASRLSITGTPVENSATDLWSQFDFLMPGFLGDLVSFKEQYDTTQALARLRAKTQPYVLRRLKSQVLAELPPKTEITLYCDFTDDQKAIYDRALVAARDEMDALQGAHSFHILRLILRLRQIACHPRLAVKKSRRQFSSGKTEEVFHTALEILAEGHKILFFSQFTRHLQLIRELFLHHKIPTFYLDGRTTDRATVVHAFKTHDTPCPFFISLKAGGTGLNLSEASYVFLLDPWWNPAVENQAIDRCHRLGQQQPVTVYRFITRGSIEEKVADLKSIKKEIESAVIDESIPNYVPLDEKALKGLIVE